MNLHSQPRPDLPANRTKSLLEHLVHPPGMISGLITVGLCAGLTATAFSSDSNNAVVPQEMLPYLAAVAGLAALFFWSRAVIRIDAQETDVFGEDPIAYIRVLVGTLAIVGTIIVSLSLLVALIPNSKVSYSVIHLSFPIDKEILFFGLILILGTIIGMVGSKVSAPASILLMLSGMAFGPEGLGVVPMPNTIVAESIASIALIIILFEGGLGTSQHHVRAGLLFGTGLATIGVIVTAAVLGVVVHYLLDFPWVLAFLLGATLSSTDASAVLNLLKQAPLPSRPSSILRLESGINDPMAIMLTAGLFIASSKATTVSDWVVFGFQSGAAGIAVGVMFGYLAKRSIDWLSMGSGATGALLGMAWAFSLYGFSSQVGASGFLAVYIGGVTIRSMGGAGTVAVSRLMQALSNGAETSLFLLLGFLVLPSTLMIVTSSGLILTAVLLFVARPLATMLSIPSLRVPWKEKAAISWLGLRGAVPIVLAFQVYAQGGDYAYLIFNIVFVVVLASLVVQSYTAIPLIKRLNLPPDASEMLEIDILPLDGVDPGIFVMMALQIPHGSPVIGRQLWENPPPGCVRVVMVHRGHTTMNPRGSTVLMENDRLVLSTEQPLIAKEEIRHWIEPDHVKLEQLEREAHEEEAKRLREEQLSHQAE